MGDHHTESRSMSTVTREDFEETESLKLSRTRSKECSIAESVAVQDALTPLEAESTDGHQGDPTAHGSWSHSVRYLVFLCALLTSLSFGVTQVPLLYVFRLMTCDAYFEEHPHQVSTSGPESQLQLSWGSVLSYALAMGAEDVGHGTIIEADRCSIRAIEASTALSISLLGASTTVFGILNLFLTGSLIKRIGVKPTLVIQVFFPALRLLVQNIGVEVWGSLGIIIIQCSQIVSIIGGPSGYLLALNTYITEVVEYEGRTAALGRLTGSMMFGSSLGFLLGGVLAEAFGMKVPFRVTLALFLAATLFVSIFLPHIPPAGAGVHDANSKKRRGFLAKFFDPMMVFAPRKFIGRDGVVRTEYGAFLLAWGVFLGILATGYLPTLLQLYATDVFGFGTKANGWLIFMYSMLRGVFLSFAFPKLIAVGRSFATRSEEAARVSGAPEQTSSAEREPLLLNQTERTTAAEGKPDTNKTVADTAPKEQTFTFDLTYTRFSLVADGLLTLLCTFVREGWQMYLVAAVLPFAAGTGSASKGTILQMVSSSASSAERTDALAGVSLVENMARLSTTFVFGTVFAGFASVGRTELVFTCNAAVALIGFGVLLFARFPLEGSRKLDRVTEAESEA